MSSILRRLNKSACVVAIRPKPRLPSSGPRRHSSSTKEAPRNPFISRPGPPPLPPEEQKEFEELVRKAQAPLSDATAKVSGSEEATVPGVERHPDAPKRLPPEFEGDVNPVTGERGGPKREPLRHGDWSFGGRVTDF